MPQSLQDELVHLRCSRCGQITSLSLGEIHRLGKPVCGVCGELLPVNDAIAESDALRKSQELDDAADALGSHE